MCELYAAKRLKLKRIVSTASSTMSVQDQGLTLPGDEESSDRDSMKDFIVSDQDVG